MNKTIEKLLTSRPVITDGAWGTQMQSLGLKQGGSPDEWNITNPEQVEKVARAYVDAGSDVILTNTFGANKIILSKHGLGDKAYEINKAGASISKKACKDNTLVFGSIGPSGKMLMMGEVTETQLRDAFAEQANGLADGGVDAIIIETMTDLKEVKIAILSATEADVPIVVSMVFDSGKEKDRTMMGTTIEDAVSALESAGADVVGANCGLGIELYVPVARRLRAATQLPIWIKPNAGMPEITDGKITYAITPEFFAGHAKTIIDEGADFIGGCCGTTPDFIKALVKLKNES